MNQAVSIESYKLSKRFGGFSALEDVSIKVRPGTVHAVLGENGAGKSTFVKCLVGYYKSDDGSVLLDGREVTIDSPTDARNLGIGMVYQHFTVVPGMTVAENLLLSQGEIPNVINWGKVRDQLSAFMESAPFKLDLDATPLDLSAGEKQKLEILKQILLHPRLLILDEPTSVLTPDEADEVLFALRQRAHQQECSIIMITHKFREVMSYCDDVSVLRRGRLVISKAVASTNSDELASAMIGQTQNQSVESHTTQKIAMMQKSHRALKVSNLTAFGDRGELALNDISFEVGKGEILGLAGVSGNGQKELLEALTGQRKIISGEVLVDGQLFHATRSQNQSLLVRGLPEEPLINACVRGMTLFENLALREFDEIGFSQYGLINWTKLRKTAQSAMTEYSIKASGVEAPIGDLSGGNVQRVVLAREFSKPANVLLVCNATFGLDFAATQEIRNRLITARNQGTAILLISEDLDEILELSDRIVVVSSGKIVYTVPSNLANRKTLGSFMAGEREVTEAIN